MSSRLMRPTSSSAMKSNPLVPFSKKAPPPPPPPEPGSKAASGTAAGADESAYLDEEFEHFSDGESAPPAAKYRDDYEMDFESASEPDSASSAASVAAATRNETLQEAYDDDFESDDDESEKRSAEHATAAVAALEAPEQPKPPVNYNYFDDFEEFTAAEAAAEEAQSAAVRAAAPEISLEEAIKQENRAATGAKGVATMAAPDPMAASAVAASDLPPVERRAISWQRPEASEKEEAEETNSLTVAARMQNLGSVSMRRFRDLCRLVELSECAQPALMDLPPMTAHELRQHRAGRASAARAQQRHKGAQAAVETFEQETQASSASLPWQQRTRATQTRRRRAKSANANNGGGGDQAEQEDEEADFGRDEDEVTEFESTLMEGAAERVPTDSLEFYRELGLASRQKPGSGGGVDALSSGTRVRLAQRLEVILNLLGVDDDAADDVTGVPAAGGVPPEIAKGLATRSITVARSGRFGEESPPRVGFVASADHRRVFVASGSSVTVHSVDKSSPPRVISICAEIAYLESAPGKDAAVVGGCRDGSVFALVEDPAEADGFAVVASWETRGAERATAANLSIGGAHRDAVAGLAFFTPSNFASVDRSGGWINWALSPGKGQVADGEDAPRLQLQVLSSGTIAPPHVLERMGFCTAAAARDGSTFLVSLSSGPVLLVDKYRAFRDPGRQLQSAPNQGQPQGNSSSSASISSGGLRPHSAKRPVLPPRSERGNLGAVFTLTEPFLPSLLTLSHDSPKTALNLIEMYPYSANDPCVVLQRLSASHFAAGYASGETAVFAVRSEAESSSTSSAVAQRPLWRSWDGSPVARQRSLAGGKAGRGAISDTGAAAVRQIVPLAADRDCFLVLDAGGNLAGWDLSVSREDCSLYWADAGIVAISVQGRAAAAPHLVAAYRSGELKVHKISELFL